MTLNKKERARYRAIVGQLARMSANGWTHATHDDYAPLEKELNALADKLTARLDPAETAQQVHTLREADKAHKARQLESTFKAQASADDWLDFCGALNNLETYGVC